MNDEGSVRVPARLTLAWLAASLVFAASGAMRSLPPVALPLMVWSPVIAIAIAAFVSPRVRASLRAIPLQVLVAFHIVRAPIGLAFLVESARGRLTPEFAELAGVGDLVVGLTAIVVVLFARRSRKLVLAWNVLGLADILAVFVTAQRVIFFGAGPSALGAFFEFPYPMVPSFVVPVVLVTHALVFVRLFAQRAATSVDGGWPKRAV